MTDISNVTYRNIATMLTKAMPEKDEDFGNMVETYLTIIKAMPTEQKIALRSALVFSHKVPRQEREDLFQDIALTLLKAKLKDEKLAYAIARCDWKDWWKKYKHRQHYSLDTVINDDTGNQTTMVELLVGEVEFELKINAELDAKIIWNLLPEHIKPIIQKRLLGQATKPTERTHLKRWLEKDGFRLLLAQ